MVLGFIFRTICGGAITIALNVIAMKVINVVEVKPMLNLVYILLAAPFGLTLLNYVISSFFRVTLLRFIPCCNKKTSPVFLTQLFKYLIIFTLTIGYSLAILLQ
jgi:hypothetical protein